MSHLVVTNDTTIQSPEDRILDAARRCVDRWGMNKLTIDDVATEANVSRATLYRIFPGGKDVMFDALRVRELSDFFAGMRASIEPVESLLDFAVKASVYALREMRNDEHLAMMLSTEEGTALKSLTVEGLPRILNVASQYMTPFLTEFIPAEEAQVLVIAHFTKRVHRSFHREIEQRLDGLNTRTHTGEEFAEFTNAQGVKHDVFAARKNSIQSCSRHIGFGRHIIDGQLVDSPTINTTTSRVKDAILRTRRERVGGHHRMRH